MRISYCHIMSNSGRVLPEDVRPILQLVAGTIDGRNCCSTSLKAAQYGKIPHMSIAPPPSRSSRHRLRGSSAPKFAEVFDPRLNSLNAVRLIMAIGVIFWHSYPITGRTIGYEPLHQAISEMWVDGFFAISGFLIVGSWFRNPDVRGYVEARLFRIAPAFWVCLIVTAFVVAPVGVWMQGGDGDELLFSTAPLTYVIKNAGIWMFQFDVGTTPTNLPFSGTWNGSLWTLGWEALCYVAVLALGVLGLLKRNWVVPATFAGLLAILIVSDFHPIAGHVTTGARFGVMFFAGALVYQYRKTLPLNWPLVVVSLLITVGTMWLPDYRAVGALFWAYAVLGIGVLIKVPALRFRNDLSYGTYIYAFPIQQLLAIAGLGAIGALGFSVVATAATLVAAAASWFLVEKPSARARKRPTPQLAESSASAQ